METALGDSREKHRYFHAFCIRPRVRFEEQQENEEVILILRAHPITQISWIFISLFLLAAPLLLAFILISILSITQFIFVNFFWYSFVFSYVFINIIDWVFNVGIVTNQRVLDIDFNLILNKEITASPLEDTTDITAKSNGFSPALFDYGDVYIQTPGLHQNIEFLRVPKPSSVVKIINELMRQANEHGDNP